MALIEWSENLSVGVSEFDKEHQKLIAIINELNDAMEEGKSKLVMGDIIKGLLDYTHVHFKREENYFSRFQFPQAESHKLEHQKLIAQVANLQERFSQGKLSLSIGIMIFLRDWLRAHIKGTDQKYARFFNEKGLR